MPTLLKRLSGVCQCQGSKEILLRTIQRTRQLVLLVLDDCRPQQWVKIGSNIQLLFGLIGKYDHQFMA